MTLAERVERLERVVDGLLEELSQLTTLLMERDRERPGRAVPETECPYYTERCLDRMTQK